MSNFTDFFPSAGGGGGGGGILNEYTFTTSGTLNLTTLGIGDGDMIYLFLCGGGSAGEDTTSNGSGGCGGAVWKGPITLGTAGTVTVVIGAGGASENLNGSATTISGGGIPSSINTGYVSTSFGVLGGSTGIVFNGLGSFDNKQSTQGKLSSPGSGFNGYGAGGTSAQGAVLSPSTNSALQNTGRGGKSANSTTAAGFSGIVKIFYS